MLLTGEDDFEFNVSAILSGHSQDVKSVKWHPTKELLFSASYDNTIKCWAYENTADDWLCRFTMQGHLSTVWQIGFDVTGQHLCSCSEDHSWAVWKIDPDADTTDESKNYKCLGVVPDHHIRSIYSISWAGKHIATGGADNRLNLVKIDTENLAEKFEFTVESQRNMAHASDINGVSFGPVVEDKQLLATVGDDQTLKVWKV